MDPTQESTSSSNQHKKGTYRNLLAKSKFRSKQKEKRKQEYFRNKQSKNYDEEDMS